MILIYTKKITPRIKYIFKHILNQRLGLKIDFTSDVKLFKKYDLFKISYDQVQFQSEFNVNPSEILFSSKIEDLDIDVVNWDGLPVFFQNDNKDSFKFDIFGASFYLMSRYEEYLLHLKDNFGRFDPSSSLAYKNRFLNKPIIDFWIQRLESYLKKIYPEIKFKNNHFKFETRLEVPCLYEYKGKGVVRTIFGVLRDVLNFDLYRLYFRFFVLLKIKKDPLDNYESWININNKAGVKTALFFLISDFSRYDRNLSFYSKPFIEKVKDVSDFCEVSLLSSYLSSENKLLLSEEKNRLNSVVNKPVLNVRQHLLKLNFPNTYRNFIKLGFESDYSLQYYDLPGFRASTSNPFFFYDLENEVETKLILNPVCISDRVLKIYKKPILARQIIEEITRYIKQVNGQMIIVLNNSIISDESKNYKWRKMFDKFLISHGKK